MGVCMPARGVEQRRARRARWRPRALGGVLLLALSSCTLDSRVAPLPAGSYRAPAEFDGGTGGRDAARCGDDRGCDADVRCDAAECAADLADGEACHNDSDCRSAHCQNGFCCAGGDCCARAIDCPGRYATGPQCDAPARCQGSRTQATCMAHQCGSEKVDDDSGCSEIVADDCGLAADSICTDAREQSAERCPAECEQDGDCDRGAHCDGACVAEADPVEDGDACERDAQCQSGHCQNARCCEMGDCCRGARDCPPRYDIAPFCTDPGSCQGYRWEATCSFNSCWSRPVVDNLACGACMPSSSD